MPNELKNVFRFSGFGPNSNPIYGDRIPGLWIRDGFFMVSSAVNGDIHYFKLIGFVIGRQYQMSIKQYLDGGEYWFEIIVDGESKEKIVNNQPKSFPNVKLYASDPSLGEPFSSDFGNVCNARIRGGR